ncbi:nuclear transport factor 2 family protein [Tahibacter harae]|uniref:Nuclear transport factor 2 family protein n=1 Tax=Tahibacter harae TaxID=2963937 RepID=A0ABT1QMH0_9GAMM|nr:nuclear transport factor 2 family protein [Tahibacter harae]MCQ4163647.1 nuclear transport factor 2 family protein [Tahibacter harae]
MRRESDLIETFYQAFQRRDGAAMAACYAPDANFRDPVFELRGADVGRMWRMLCERGKDLRVEYNAVQANGDRGSANWQAWYSFSKTGRPVHNLIHAEFEFRDGRIARHVDSFDFWRWSRQALGPAGLLLGWTPLLRNKVRAEARRGLEKFTG